MSVEETFHLRVLHFNDLHGRLADFSGDKIAPVFSRIAGFIARARAEVAGRRDAGVLVLSGGDDLAGSPFAELTGTRPEQFRSHPAYRLYSSAGVDASAVGNHELDWGIGMLSLAAERDAQFPILSANLVQMAGVPAQIRPWTIANVNGLRVGIVGLTSPSEVKRLVPDAFQICDPLLAVLAVLPAVRAQSDIVVLLSHLGHCQTDGYPPPRGMRDVELALALPHRAVSVIVGSHTHSVLNEGGLDAANMVNGMLLAQAGSHGRYLGDIEIEVTSAGAEVVDARLWPVEALPDDPEIEQAQVQPLARTVKKLLSEPVGEIDPRGDLTRAPFGSAERALANFVADALAARCRTGGLPVDFFMLDSPGPSDALPQGGRLTFSDLFRVAPYEDSIVLLRIPAGLLQAFLDDNARRADVPGEPPEERGFVQFSREVRYRIEGRDEPNQRLVRAAAVTLGGSGLSQLGQRDLVAGCSSFFREFSLPWEQRAARQGHPIFDVRSLPCEYTRLSFREELVAHVREAGGITEATGLARDGRVVFHRC